MARRPAGHGCPTGTLRFSQQTRPDYRPNSRGLAPGTTLTGPCPAALRAPTCRLHSSPFLAPKRRQPDAICRKSQARVRAGARKVAEGGSLNGDVYLIGTVENRHPRPLSPRDCRVPAQQLSRYAGEVACPAGGRRGDNLRTSGQVDSGVRARRCIRRPGWVMWARGRAGEVERWRHTCAVTSSSPPSRRPDRRLFRSRGGEARSRTTPPAKLTLPAAPP